MYECVYIYILNNVNYYYLDYYLPLLLLFSSYLPILIFYFLVLEGRLSCLNFITKPLFLSQEFPTLFFFLEFPTLY